MSFCVIDMDWADFKSTIDKVGAILYSWFSREE